MHCVWYPAAPTFPAAIEGARHMSQYAEESRCQWKNAAPLRTKGFPGNECTAALVRAPWNDTAFYTCELITYRYLSPILALSTSCTHAFYSDSVFTELTSDQHICLRLSFKSLVGAARCVVSSLQPFAPSSLRPYHVYWVGLLDYLSLTYASNILPPSPRALTWLRCGWARFDST
jgi:hypothetical protein